MIRLYNDSKIYIFCPANIETGGTELAHQLVDYLTGTGRNSYIVYICQKEIVDVDVPNSFCKYRINKAIEIEDVQRNIIVPPEIFFDFIAEYENVQIAFWWMSVDNYYPSASIEDAVRFYDPVGLLKFLYSRIRFKQPIFKYVNFNKIREISYRSIHLYQSEYAHDHLIKTKHVEHLPLSDYINTEFVSGNISRNKENIILYNPAKGFRFTKKIIKMMPNNLFIPLKGMKRDELNDYFKRAKVYIDFGNHPGKDRIPREAAINGCCIITGKKGSAKYFEDIPIPSKYKFSTNEQSINLIVNQINYIFNNYETVYSDFNFYRMNIASEKNKFYNEIENVFHIDDM